MLRKTGSTTPQTPKGPLVGVRVLEFASKGPGPFCCMLLSDMGADVLRLDRPASDKEASADVANPLDRGRRSVAIDLKNPAAARVVVKLCEKADILVEGMRPGAMERLGFGPEALFRHNPCLVYGRMTGWGQTGPLAKQPGHDINYIATSGVLAAIGGSDGPPVAPLNLVGDFGGALYLAMGLIAALYETAASGKGQVVDAAMVDSSVSLMASYCGAMAAGRWSDVARGSHLTDGGAPFYTTYRTADDKYVAVGAIERKFFAVLIASLGLPVELVERQNDRSTWPELHATLATTFAAKTRDEWVALFAGREACLSPVLTLSEAMTDEHNRARQAFTTVDGLVQPAPAPRFSRTPSAVQGPPHAPGADTLTALRAWGCDDDDVRALLEDGVIVNREEA